MKVIELFMLYKNHFITYTLKKFIYIKNPTQNDLEGSGGFPVKLSITRYEVYQLHSTSNEV
jgi:hypothetical protein